MMSQTYYFAAFQSSSLSKSLLVVTNLSSFVPVKTSKRSFRKARSALNDCPKDSVMNQHTGVMVCSPDVLMKGGSRRC